MCNPTDKTPKFCPHCGAQGTITVQGTVFCESGEYDGKSYETEGNFDHFSCSSCGGEFVDFSK